MNSFVLLTVFFAATHAASISADERLALVLKYGADCANETGVTVSSLFRQTPSNDDPAYNDYIKCFYEKYFAAAHNHTHTVDSRLIQNIPVILSYSKECAIESQISVTALVKIADQHPPVKDPAYRRYVLCYLLKLGILTENGDVSDDATEVEKWFRPGLAQDLLDSLKTNCGGLKGDTLEDKGVLLFKCFTE